MLSLPFLTFFQKWLISKKCLTFRKCLTFQRYLNSKKKECLIFQHISFSRKCLTFQRCLTFQKYLIFQKLLFLQNDLIFKKFLIFQKLLLYQNCLIFMPTTYICCKQTKVSRIGQTIFKRWQPLYLISSCRSSALKIEKKETNFDFSMDILF